VHFSLTDPDLTAASGRLDFTLVGRDPLLRWLRRVPLLGSIAPTPQVIQWEHETGSQSLEITMPGLQARSARMGS
jgi:hypothetical protein